MSLQAMLWASNLEVPASTKLVAMIMGDHANTRNECWPSKAKLAKRCSLSKGTVSRALKDLADWGLIEVEAREHESGKPRSNKYTLRLDRAAPPDALDRSTIDPSPGDDEESDDETMACETPDTAVTGGRVNHESMGRSHGEPMGRTHGEPMDGLTVDPTNRTTQSEPSPLNPPDASGQSQQGETTPPSPSREAAGSAGKEKGPSPDPNSDQFIRLQFEQLVNCWQQAGLIRFAGDEVAAWKIFREKPFERRVSFIAKAPNYLKGKSAEYARWNATASRDRSRAAPRPASVKDFIANELDRFVGTPSEPPPMPKAPPKAWVEAIAASRRSQYDPNAAFVQCPSQAFTAWVAAFKSAGLGTFGYRSYRFESEGEGTYTRNGAWFVSEYPPAESEFEEQPTRGAA